jgi:hypothetical protein
VAASVAGLATWDSLTGGIWRDSEQQQTYSQSVTALTVKGGASDVEVRGGAPAGTVRVQRHLSWGPGRPEPQPRETFSGRTLTIDAGCDESFLSWCSIDYVVTVPDATTVDVDTGSGDVTVSGALGRVDLVAGSGDIDATELAATSLSGRTGSGDIDVQLTAAAASVDLRAGSGDVSVRLPQDRAYAVSTDSGSGDREVTVRTDPAADDRVSVATGSGDIEVAYR